MTEQQQKSIPGIAVQADQAAVQADRAVTDLDLPPGEQNPKQTRTSPAREQGRDQKPSRADVHSGVLTMDYLPGRMSGQQPQQQHWRQRRKWSSVRLTLAPVVPPGG